MVAPIRVTTSVLDHRQEAVLLGAVEAMDLVDEQQRALAGTTAARGVLEDPLEVGDAREDGGNLREEEIGLFGDEARDGVFCRHPGGPQRMSEASEPRASMRVTVPWGPRR